MAIISGTLGADTLTGTSGDDILSPLGSDTPTPELLSGLDGADVYSLYRAAGTGYYSYIIDDMGTDGAIDTIGGAQLLHQVTKAGGVETWASAERVGNDLLIHLPSKAWGIRDPYVAPTDIRIVDHYGSGTVEVLSTGWDAWSLATGTAGTAGADLIAGGATDDRIRAGSGADWAFGNGGADRLWMGAGNDTAFGGDGDDKLAGQSGNDRLFGDNGNDTLLGGGGNDTLSGGQGTNLISTGRGADVVQYGPLAAGDAIHDTVTDFDPAHDRFDFVHSGLGFADLTLTDGPGGAEVSWSSGTGAGPELLIELSGVALAELAATHFLFV